MPVTAAPPSPPCLHCQECGRRECCLVFRVQLDADLLHTLVSIYPEWFNMQPISPPKAEVDDSPLHQAMDKNKESLKVKLMLRRPINQLVAQGIMPPLKTPPGFHEQRQKLERAKMGDLLKAKIQQRPDRQELVRQHILEDVGHVDPSLAERQRQLKKCRLADSLNDQLSHRPGPLELIKKNILHTEEPIERAVKEGHIEFKATSEGQSTKPTPPDHYMLDEDSSSAGGSPGRELIQTTATILQATGGVGGDQQQPSIVTVLLTPTAAIALPTAPPPAPPPQLYSAVPSPSTSTSASSAPSTPRPSPAPGKDKNRKKSKAKAQPKARTIKFHEYKGPPNAQKSSPQNSSSVETSYELLLQQQQLFLQWQLEWQHKYPQILLPASQKPVVQVSSGSIGEGSVGGGSSVGSPAPPPPPLPQSPPPPPPPPLRNLEDMKVSDLKAELKRRNLPVSGAKPQLIERLKPFSESAQNSANNSNSNNSIQANSHQSHQDDSSVCNGAQSSSSVEIEGSPLPSPNSPSGTTGSLVSLSSPLVSSVASPGPLLSGLASPPPPTPSSTLGLSLASPQAPSSVIVAMETDYNDSIIREQQRTIDQLQRQLINSQLQLQNTFQQPVSSSTTGGSQQSDQQQQQQQQVQMSNAKANLAAFLQQQQLNQAILQQQQQQQQQQESLNNNNNNVSLVFGKTRQHQVVPDQQAILNHINLRVNQQHSRTGSLPNFVGTFVNGQTGEITQTDLTNFIENKQLFLEAKPEIKTEVEGVKSQIVDDVLEILIKNGELPASAAEVIGEHSGGELLETMEVESELMDVDTDWLDSLMDGGDHTGVGVGLGGGGGRTCGDPLLGVGPSSPEPPFIDLFMDDSELKMPTPDFLWDRIDFAT